jgi:tetratricopeptide (TPR) repeat protein
MADTKYKYDMFLSYSGPDAESVEMVARYLSDAGLNIWFDRWSLVPGQSWQIVLEEALESSFAVAVFIGPSALSNRQQQEWEARLAKQMSGTLRKITIPVLLPGSTWDSVPSILRNLFSVDLREGLDNPRELNRLVAAIGYLDRSDAITQNMQRGDDLFQAGDSSGALTQYENALRIAVAVHGELHPLITTILNQIARTQQEVGAFESARQNLEKLLKIDSKTYGTDHPNVARDVNSLGSVLKDLGDLQGAKEHYERALSIFQKFLGEDHPSTATVRNNLELLANV